MFEVLEADKILFELRNMLFLNFYLFNSIKALIRFFQAFVNASVTARTNLFQEIVFLKERVLVNEPTCLVNIQVALWTDSCTLLFVVLTLFVVSITGF